MKPAAGTAAAFCKEASRPLPINRRADELTLALIELERIWLERLHRLQQLELQLRKMALRKRGPLGRRAVRQIELDRQRLGRELHTGVGQLLAAIRLQLEVVDTQLGDIPAAARLALDRIGVLAADALEQVRAVSRRLYAPEWQRLTLDAALKQLWEISGMSERFPGMVRIQPLRRDPPPDVKTLFYRVAQEAVSNIIRHSRAARVDVTLEEADGRVALTVQDNGVGFDSTRLFSDPPNLASGIGLRSIRDQAAGLGGKLLIESGTRGTKLEVSVPLYV